MIIILLILGLAVAIAASRGPAIATNLLVLFAVNGERRRIVVEGGPTIGTTGGFGQGTSGVGGGEASAMSQPVIGGSIEGTRLAGIGQTTGAETGGVAGRTATATTSTSAGNPLLGGFNTTGATGTFCRCRCVSTP